MDLTLHAARFPVSLEKWYIDTLLDDGSILLVYLGALTISGVRLARATAEYYAPDGLVAHGSVSVRRITGGENALRFGPVNLVGERLQFRMEGLSGNLVYHPRWAPYSLREPFLAQGSRTLHWSLEIPDADVSGILRWPGGERTIVGRGYRDRVWFDLSPWRFPIRELIWGRAAAGYHAATWVRAATSQGTIAAAWLDGRPARPDAGSGLPPGVSLGPSRIFIDADVAGLESLRLGALRGPLRRLSGDPHETKWQAPCVIMGAQGVAAHEVVRWRT